MNIIYEISPFSERLYPEMPRLIMVNREIADIFKPETLPTFPGKWFPLFITNETVEVHHPDVEGCCIYYPIQA